MANPVFSRAEAFQPRGNPYGQPAYAGQGLSLIHISEPTRPY